MDDKIDDDDCEYFEDSLVVGSRYIANAIFRTIRWMYEPSNIGVDSLLVKGLWLYSSVLVQLDNASIYCYNNSSVIRNSVDYAIWINENINDYLSNRYREPIDDNWIQVCSLYENDNNCLLYTYKSTRDRTRSRMTSSA